jgi:hypothetical protein
MLNPMSHRKVLPQFWFSAEGGLASMLQPSARYKGVAVNEKKFHLLVPTLIPDCTADVIRHVIKHGHIDVHGTAPESFR